MYICMCICVYFNIGNTLINLSNFFNRELRVQSPMMAIYNVTLCLKYIYT